MVVLWLLFLLDFIKVFPKFLSLVHGFISIFILFYTEEAWLLQSKLISLTLTTTTKTISRRRALLLFIFGLHTIKPIIYNVCHIDRSCSSISIFIVITSQHLVICVYTYDLLSGTCNIVLLWSDIALTTFFIHKLSIPVHLYTLLQYCLRLFDFLQMFNIGLGSQTLINQFILEKFCFFLNMSSFFLPYLWIHSS